MNKRKNIFKEASFILIGTLLVLALIFLIMPRNVSATPMTETITVDDWHGGHCELCGEIDYACSTGYGSWPTYVYFTDPVPTGTTVTNIKVTLYGACSGYTKVYINNLLINEKQITWDCWCGTCHSDDFISQEYPTGFPGYVYGGTNSLRLEVTSGTLCMSHAVIELTNIALDPLPPVADAGGPYVSDEGTPITFDASGSYDVNGDAMEYRWDFDNDGVWDTSYSSDPLYSKNFGNDFTGTVKLEVLAGGDATTDTATVTVNNVAPVVSLWGIAVVDNYILATNYYAQSYYLDISSGSIGTPAFIDDKYLGTYGAGIGDFDNDGDLDALIGDRYNTWYYEKTGTGNSFASAVSIDTTYHTYRMDFAEADFNNDGNLDAIMADHSSNYFTIYLGNGDGTFTKSTMSSPLRIVGMDSADFNGDGNMDFIAASYSRGAYIYLGNGDGTFVETYLDIEYSWGVCAGDFNNDGYDDFIFGRYNARFYPGFGDGTFGLSTSLGFSPYGLAESDINGDGNLDIVYTTYDSVGYRTGNGDGTFSYDSSTYVSSRLYNIATSVCEGESIETDEGNNTLYTGEFSDTGWLDTHTATWDWGDGSPSESGTVTEENIEPHSTGEVSGNHPYGDDGMYTITLTVFDDDTSGSDTGGVIVNNVAPTVNAGDDQTAFVGTPAYFSGSFYDPGWLDTHTIEWDWGDNTPVDSGTLTPQHTYTQTGVFTVTLTVTDDDGGVGIDTLTVTAISNLPPIANANGPYVDYEGNEITFDASGSTDPNNDPLEYRWDFNNDGIWDTNRSTDPTATNTWFDDYSGTVAVEVWDGTFTDIATATVSVLDLAPTASFTWNPEPQDEGSHIQFSDTSTSYPDNIIQWSWDFGGIGTSLETNPSYAFFDDGTYNVCLTVTDDDGSTDTICHTVTVLDLGPTASFNWYPEPQDEGSETYFSDTSTSYPDDIIQWSWDFGGIGTSSDQNPSYVFPDDGTYNVCLTVTDDDGSIDTICHTVTVLDLDPTASFTWDPEPQDEGSHIQFSDTSTSYPDDIIQWSWDFGGIGTSSDQNPSYVFPDDGTYNVCLTVTDDDGSTDTYTISVVVNNVAPQVFLWGGVGATDNYVLATSYSCQGFFIDIDEESGQLSTSYEMIDDQSYGTYGAAVGDFDNDGDNDAIYGDLYNTWYYEKTGTGNDFAPAVSIDSAYQANRNDFAEADFNNDGNLDAIMACYYNYYFTIYLGNGDGTFNRVTLNSPRWMWGMDSGDFNNDGNMDFVASCRSPDAAHIYLGNGDGTFQSPIIMYTNVDGRSVCAGDFNNDGNDDLVYGFAPVMFYPGNGDGTFGIPTSLGFNAYGLAETDIDGDGNLDIVYTYSYRVQHRAGNGDGTFTWVSDVYITSIYGIATAPYTGVLTVDEGYLEQFIGTFTDFGWLDTHTAIWNWGDNSPTESGTVIEENDEPMAIGNVTGTHSYGDNGEYTISLTVTDDDGGSTTETATVIVYNVPPSVDAGSDQIAFVGIPAYFVGSFTDPGWLDTHTIEWDWGDDLPVGSGTLTPQHTFTDAGVFTVTLTVTDDDGAAGSDTLTVTVYFPPVAAGIDQTVDEGDTVNFDATQSTGSSWHMISNPGFDTSDFSQWTVYIPPGGSANVVTTHNGDMGMAYSPIDGSYFSLLKTDGPNSYTTVSQTFNTITGETISGWAAFDARDYMPYNDNACVQIIQGGVVVATPWYSDVTIVGNYGDSPWEEWNWTASSSGIYTLEYRIANYGDSGVDSYAMFDSTIAGMNYYPINSYEWDFDNDGTYDYQETPSNAPDGLFDGKTTQVYGDNIVFTATVQITDELGETDTDTCIITVNNVAPTITTLTAPIDPVQLGNSISANAEFTDPGFLDTHTASIDWGDNIIEDLGAVTSPIPNQTHTYTTPGVYTITLTVTDDDGDNDTLSFKYVVIYDPNDGFVTGGGWIMSPEGAYTPNSTLTGKANFGFVAKYKQGQSTPDGNTEFQFKVANLNFHSNDYEWLVIQIAGAKAMYKGTGTINGEGNYGFKITAIDEDLTPSTDVDMFRIKIWDKDNNDEIIYDNQLGDEDDVDPSTPIGGGNIKIHEG